MGIEIVEGRKPIGPGPIIFDTDSSAASYRTDISGWVSRHGNYFGEDEKMARWDGATHVACQECGANTLKHYTLCDSCCKARDTYRWNHRYSMAWDGRAMLYSEIRDQYFTDPETAAEELKEGETLAGLRLVICEPVYLREIDEDHWADDLPEDGELPDAVHRALEALNQAIREAGTVSWMPGKLAVDLADLKRAGGENEAEI